MAIDDVARKKMAHVIAIGIEPAKKSDSKKMDDEESSEADPALVAAMEDFLSALEKKDPDGMADAFASAHEICKHAEYGAETEEDDDEG